MSWLDGLRHRAHSLFHARDHEREAMEEMSLHLELDAMQQRDARRARRRFGNRTYYMEARRQAAGLAFLDSVRQDASYAWRSIRRSPAFTAAVIVTLALGIGVNTAAFSILDTIYLRPPSGVRAPDELRRVWIKYVLDDNTVSTSQDRVFYGWYASYSMYHAIASALGDSVTIGLYRTEKAGHDPNTLHVAYVTANYLPLLGAKVQLGRLFGKDEDILETGGARVALVSDRYWRARMGADSTVIKRDLKVGGRSYRVIGVTAPDFQGVDLQAVDVWVPFAAQPSPEWIQNKRWWESDVAQLYRIVMRLPDGMTDEQVSARATDAIRRLAHSKPHPGGDTLSSVATGSVIAARGPAKAQQEQIISTRLGGVAVIVLLIAFANVLNLLLARAVRRRREIAVRLALGVSRWRLVRLLMTETVLLATIATGVALIVGGWTAGVLRTLLIPDVEWQRSTFDMRLAAVTIAIGLACGIIAGLVPALQSSRPQLTPALKDGARESSGPSRSRGRATLIVAQAALSVVLLTGAALFVRSLRNVLSLDIGYDRTQLLFGWNVFEEGQKTDERVQAAAIQQIAEELEGRPEFESVARAMIIPMRGFSVSTLFTDRDTVRARGNEFPVHNYVTPNFFATAGLRFLRGTTFDPAQPSLVVNEEMAKRLWPGRNPIGQCLYVTSREGPCWRVTGVVENGRRGDIIEKDPLPIYYVSASRGADDTARPYATTIIARTKPGFARAASSALRRALERGEPGAYPTVRSMSDMLDEQYRPWRLGAQLFSALGALALIVAIVGIYSTVSYGVSQRTQEFGVRVALGARTHNVLTQVLGEGLRVVAVGVLLGVALTAAGGRLIASLLYGVKPADPVTLALVGVSLLATAALATLVPAWRASRVDPVRALRAD